MNKKTLVILGIIAALAAAIIIQRTVHFSSVPSVSAWEGTADEVVIRKGTAPEIRIAKKEGAWFVGAQNYPAEESIVSTLVKKLDEFKLSDLVTKKEFYERFDLSDDRAVRVTVKGNGKVLRDILVGKKSGAGDNTYVKFPDKKEVYLAGGSLSFELGKDVEGFRSHTLLKCPIETMESIAVKYKGQNYTLVRTVETVPASTEKAKDAKKPETVSADKWSLAGSTAALDQDKVKNFAGEFGNIMAQSFVPDADVKKKSGTPQCEITIKSGGRDLLIKVFGPEGKDGKDGYALLSGENPWLAIVNKTKSESIMKALKDLQAK